MSFLFGGIEAGGTKFVCVLGTDPENILFEKRFPTTNPEETIQYTIAFFQEKTDELGIEIASLGLGCFGPVDLNVNSKKYGYITTTPKLIWRDTDIVRPIENALNVPVIFDTDVNAAAIGEGKWGAGINLENFVYFTIGTGIGAGAIINQQPVHGLIHPEMGHVLLTKNPLDNYKGKCPYHANCFEGFASGPAIEERWGKPADSIPPSHPAWDMEADYIAQALCNIICTISPQKIILGGGVMQQLHLFQKIRQKTKEYLNGYIPAEIILENIDEYIVPPKLGNRAGMLGAIAMAQTICKG